MNNLSKLLYAVKNDAAIFRNEDVNFILGLTSSVIKKLKKNGKSDLSFNHIKIVYGSS